MRSFLLVLATTGTALALKPGTHADVATKSCTAAGLPREFCTRVATEDYDTDAREWDDLSAHAQIDDNMTACDAADRAAMRVWQLGRDVRANLRIDAELTATALGRALHTIQDDCAHHGMPNPQHAWFSLEDFCDGTELSPDIQPGAITCARAESDAVMALVADAVAGAQVADFLAAASCPDPNLGEGGGNRAPCQDRYLPGPGDACSFFARASDWDGIDRTWNTDVAVPALRAAFAAGLAGQNMPASMCGGDETVLSNATSAPMLDVSGGTPTCNKAHVFCLGGADSGDNPFADDPTPPGDGGCSSGGARGLALGLALLLVVRRRR